MEYWKQLLEELVELDQMTDREACQYYNTDSKAEVAEIIIEDWYNTLQGKRAQTAWRQLFEMRNEK
jgi:hypothetical protein